MLYENNLVVFQTNHKEFRMENFLINFTLSLYANWNQ